ncbi:Uncharacterized protein LACOL_1496 [Paucilactobacillus oligofermentans DSM 15707 = LMG 22743]|nr:Uncharacterized protein LACOL_1496 [Paucilactobacillus oligofermentans DSM 15707 = LMG 22743]
MSKLNNQIHLRVSNETKNDLDLLSLEKNESVTFLINCILVRYFENKSYDAIDSASKMDMKRILEVLSQLVAGHNAVNKNLIEMAQMEVRTNRSVSNLIEQICLNGEEDI